jgi:hypothetical protein
MTGDNDASKLLCSFQYARTAGIGKCLRLPRSSMVHGYFRPQVLPKKCAASLSLSVSDLFGTRRFMQHSEIRALRSGFQPAHQSDNVPPDL